MSMTDQQERRHAMRPHADAQLAADATLGRLVRQLGERVDPRTHGIQIRLWDGEWTVHVYSPGVVGVVASDTHLPHAVDRVLDALNRDGGAT